jgi:hypothetical protein
MKLEFQASNAMNGPAVTKQTSVLRCDKTMDPNKAIHFVITP